MRVLDIVIDFLASVLGTVLQSFMALTGDSPQTPETAPTWVNVETFSAVGELLDRYAGQFSHALLKVNSQCSAPMAAISCFSLPFTAALKKKVERPVPDAWMLKRNIHKVPNANDSVTLSFAGKRYCITVPGTTKALSRVASVELGSQAGGRVGLSKWLMNSFLRRTNRQSFNKARLPCSWGRTSFIDFVIDHDRQRSCRTRSRLITIRADVTRVQRGFHVAAMRMRSHELDFYSRFCSKSPPPPPPKEVYRSSFRTTGSCFRVNKTMSRSRELPCVFSSLELVV